MMEDHMILGCAPVLVLISVQSEDQIPAQKTTQRFHSSLNRETWGQNRIRFTFLGQLIGNEHSDKYATMTFSITWLLYFSSSYLGPLFH